MADSNIAVDGGEGKLLQTYENTIGGEDVHAEAVSVVDTTGSPINEANPFSVNQAPESVTPKSITVTTSGNTIVVTPASGKAIRLWWWSLSALSTNGAAVQAALRWTTGGADFVKTDLSQFGGILSHNYKGGAAYVQGAVDEALIVNLSAAQTVFVNIDYEEITL